MVVFKRKTELTDASRRKLYMFIPKDTLKENRGDS